MASESRVGSGFGAWDEWHYRHEFFWATTTRWLVAVLATAALPYTSGELRTSFGLYAIAFPGFACILGALAWSHLLAEHARVGYVRWEVGRRGQEKKFISDAKTVAQAFLCSPVEWRMGKYVFA